jgi:transposase
MGWFQQVHAKSIGSQEIRALLVARKQLLGRLLDVELSIRGILRGFGLKVGQVTRKRFEAPPTWPDLSPIPESAASGPNRGPTARSPVAETVELVKPLHAQWPSSDEPRVSR